MKTKKIYLAILLLSVIAWSCTTQNELSNNSLKSSINASAQSLTTAMNSITSTAGYQILSTQGNMSGQPMMARQSVVAFDSTYNQILLTDVAGIWDYKAAWYKRCNPSLLRFFQNTGTSADMVVRLPKSKVKNPSTLLHFEDADTTLANNYVIGVSKYAYHFNRFLGWDYDMASNITVDGTNVGDLAIQSSKHRTKGYHFVSGFTFANGYVASASYISGDTIISTYNISKANTTLYEERYTAIRTSSTSKHREKTYSLTIGNVKIVREAGPNSLDSAKVYVNNVLQLHSVVKIIAYSTTTVENENKSTVEKDDDDESTVTKQNRTIQITFDDGTTTTIKALLGSTISDISTLFASIRQAYFATGIVDWIAWDIYKNKK